MYKIVIRLLIINHPSQNRKRNSKMKCCEYGPRCRSQIRPYVEPVQVVECHYKQASHNQDHRAKTRAQMLAKMFPRLKVLCQLFMGPTLGSNTKQRNSFLIKFGVFFYNKSKILSILLIVKYEKITHFDEFLVLLGPIISRFFCMFK
jgi:hypothetical protein